MMWRSGQDVGVCDGFGNESTGQYYLETRKQSGESAFGSLDQVRQQGVTYSEDPLNLIADSGTFPKAGQMITKTDLSAALATQPFNFENTYAFDDYLGEVTDHENPRGQVPLAIDPVELLNESLIYFDENPPFDQFTNKLGSSVADNNVHLLQCTTKSPVTEEEIASKLSSAMQSPEQATQSTKPQQMSSQPTQALVRAFSCGINGCTKAYKRTYELRRHQRVHSPAKPHGCHFPFCTKSGQNGFVRKDHLRQHLRQVHGV